MSGYSEDELIEQPSIDLLKALGWETANCFDEFATGISVLGRQTASEVILISHLFPVLQKLNPKIPPEALNIAISDLMRDRGRMSLAAANREVYCLLKDGIKISFRSASKEEVTEIVKVIDWDNPQNNDFFLASQFWIAGDMYTRRADLVGFVNGIPILFVELKACHKALKSAYDDNFTDYKTAIPQIFWYNGLVILSNGSKACIGSLTALWEHFSEWKRINTEGEKGVVSLETMLRGTCEPARLLDLVENFAVFMEARGGYIKLTAKNHQYLGVNNTLEALKNIGENKGRLGVFWHTQGSGKSVSMIYFAQKVLRKLPGHWTFLIVTDRDELDKQIYKNFADSHATTELECQAESGAHLKQLLSEDHRYIFTLIQKFHTEPGQRYPVISERSDIIVITDEAHRSQYDLFAMNMRSALPNAAFIGFTGTPLMIGEEKTRQVFGDYVSVYNFQQSIEDGATVPLFYENRIPELQITNPQLNNDMASILENADLDERQEKKFEREFAREYHLITRDDRLERIAEDMVSHHMGRDFSGTYGPGKAMVISVDKATAVKLYDKVQKYWVKYLKNLEGMLDTSDIFVKSMLETRIKYMKVTEMAVVVSQSQNEIEELKSKGADIVPHRKKMVKEDLAKRFKDEDDKLRIVFVCAMWMTGFDVPCCSTIYLDKPMRNHTLMQTIARANRVFPEKVNGLIVDYIGVFRDLQKALAIYAPTPESGERPIKDKAELIALLNQAIADAKAFLAEHGVDVDKVLKAEGFDKVAQINGAVKAIVMHDSKAYEGALDDTIDKVLINDESKQRYLQLALNVNRVFRAIKPDPVLFDYLLIYTLIVRLADKIYSLTSPADIAKVMGQVEKLLDESISIAGYAIHAPKGVYQTENIVDLSKIDFEKLRKQFEQGKKRIEIEKLKGALNSKLQKMVRINRTRMDFLNKFQEMIDEYNSGSAIADEFFDRLIEFAQGLNQEDKRAISENLSEEELAIFDLLTRPKIKLTKKETQQVKAAAKNLLDKLKKEMLVLDWRKKQQTRAAVKLTIEQILEQLPETYTRELYAQKCGVVYQHVYESYIGPGESIYSKLYQN